MPLAFQSMSHGTVAFGFFNIESDMLLLDELFFFADRFCAAVCEIARGKDATIEGYRISERSKAGNLHGAIQGVDHSGLIGATYLAWPFPATQEGFKQNPEGWKTRKQVEAMMEPFGQPEAFAVRRHKGEVFSLGEYQFSPQAFAELIGYVDRGGYPRWRGEVRPDYVAQMVRPAVTSCRD